MSNFLQEGSASWCKLGSECFLSKVFWYSQSLNIIFCHLTRYQRRALAGALFFHVSLLFIFQGGFFVHLSGDLRIALAAVVGGIVNLLGMRRTLCSACKIMKLMTTMIL